MTPPPDSSEEIREASTSRKRKRVPTACRACRARKSRCDGERPNCSSCVEQGLQCVYAVASGPKEALVPKAYLDLVEARLSAVEVDLCRVKAQVASNQDTQPAAVTGDRSATVSFDELANEDDDVESETSPDATDGVGTIEFTTEETSAYFGPSSNIAFTRIFRRTLANLLQKANGSAPNSASRPHLHRDALAASRPASPARHSSVAWTSQMTDPACLPPDEEVTRLARQFFSETGMLFPYVNESAFWETYHRFSRSGKKKIRNSWLGLLNMILAMATSTGTRDGQSMQDRYSQSEIYFNRAKALCLDHMLSGASIETVQVMLLMTQYLQGTHRSIKTWAIHGLAVKAAFQLGLHVPQALPSFSPLERETRLRTWYGCVVLDRGLSMTFGRPPSIPEALNRTPLPRHCFEIGNQPPTAWSSEESSTLFWNATITLYNINALIIQDLYGSNVGDADLVPIAEKISCIFQIEQRLFDWKLALPAPLALVECDDVLNAEGKVLAWKFRVILTLRYHNLNVLAHRPVLDRHLQLLDSPDDATRKSTILRQMGQLSLHSCLKSAQAIIAIVATCLSPGGQDNRSSFLGAWWFTLHYTMNATLIIASVMTIQQADGDPCGAPRCTPIANSENLEKSLDDAIAIMTKLDRQNRMLEKCVKFTATLRHLLQNNLASTQTALSLGVTTRSALISEGENLTMELMPLDYHFDNVDFESEDLFISPGFMDSMACDNDIF